MYMIAASALMFYVTKIPERYFPGESQSGIVFNLNYSEMCIWMNEQSDLIFILYITMNPSYHSVS